MVNGAWKSEPLGKAATLQRGFDLPHRQRKPGTVPIVTSSGFGDSHNESKVVAPGVVTGRYGTIGEVFYVQTDFWPLNTTLYVRDFHGNDPLFVSYLLRTLDFHSHSGKSGVPGVNRNDLHEIIVRFPSSKAEQETIAEALSDADALIESLEQLIAKKRQIKQGAMQELLTGKKRLPGFDREWEERSLDSVIDRLEAGVSVNSVEEDSGEYPHDQGILKTSAVSDGRFLAHECKKISPRDLHRARLNPARNSIIISRMNTPDLVGECGYVEEDYPLLFLPDRLWMTRFAVGSVTNARWLSYLLSTAEYKRRIKAAATGTSGSMKNLSKDALLSLLVRFPTPQEQTAIAAILSDMDAEITALEAKLAKTRQIKQGMMHNLLTGKIRLI